MKSKRIKFQIDQLRKDKIIYATEACATTLVCILAYFISNEYLVSPTKDVVSIFLAILAAGYTTYMGVGNLLRLMKIQKLEKELWK